MKLLYMVMRLGYRCEDVVVQWCNPLTLQLEKLVGQGSIPGRSTTRTCIFSTSVILFRTKAENAPSGQ